MRLNWLTPDVIAHDLFLLSFPGLLLAATAIGPAFGFITGSIMQRFYVDFDKFSKGDRKHCSVDQRLEKKCLVFFSGRREDQLLTAAWPQRLVSWEIKKTNDLKSYRYKKMTCRAFWYCNVGFSRDFFHLFSCTFVIWAESSWNRKLWFIPRRGMRQQGVAFAQQVFLLLIFSAVISHYINSEKEIEPENKNIQ